MKHFLSFFVCMGLAMNAIAQLEDIRKEINKIIRYDTEIEYEDTPGFLVGIIDRDTNFVLGFGSLEEYDYQNDPGIIFEIGSVTKMFTSRLCHLLESQGLISLKASINSFLPPDYHNPRLAHLTLSHLLNHYSGFPKRPKDFGRKEKEFNNPYKYYSKSDLLHFYKNFIPAPDKKSKFLYSHLNYALIETVLEFACNKSYSNLLNEFIFKPLELEQSFISFAEQMIPKFIQGHNRAGLKVKPWEFSSFAGSEGIKSEMSDLISFTRAQFKAPPSHFNEYGTTDLSKRIYVAQGWYKIKQKDLNIYGHSGKTSGHYAFIGFVRETNTAVIVMANSSMGTEDLGYLILRMINYNWKRKA